MISHPIEIFFVSHILTGTTASQSNYIKLLCDAAPMFSEMCRWIQQRLKDDDKLLIVENVPLVSASHREGDQSKHIT